MVEASDSATAGVGERVRRRGQAPRPAALAHAPARSLIPPDHPVLPLRQTTLNQLSIFH
ncbi:hypothetical protein JYU34_017979 [Plutella xylostella]|uniref:Uncharacterized protein n=1 Tax=Plutella xylostella TaxID=51655 RepID=A0ABQ7PZF4_PLUXY|nr:hypothetical protein JYU34_017979 [Plutella xylostella]